jgi:sRNA-binding regulator protein Hfq
MRSIIFLLSFFLFSCGESPEPVSSAPIKKPSWYQAETSNGKNKISYGFGKTLEKARQNAYSEMARKIGVKVTADFERIVNCEKSGKGENCNKKVSSESSQKAKYFIADAEILEEQMLDNFHFVKLKYIDESLIEGLRRKSANSQCGKPKNLFLRNVEILNNLKCSPAGLRISEKNGIFRFENWEFTQVINFDEFSKLFFEKENRDIKIYIDDFENGFKKRGYLKNNDEYDILLKAKKRGYLTTLFLSDTGEVYMFQKDLKVSRNETVSLSEKMGTLYVKLEKSENESRAMIITVFSEQPNSTEIFFGLKHEDNKDKYVHFEKLYKMFDKKINFATKILEVRR